MHDIISPAYVGFYHVPFAWCSEVPSEEIWRRGSIEEVLKIVHEGELQVGIRYRVRRDGLIWFDCNKWEPGKYTKIPGYDSKSGSKVPKRVIDAEKLAEDRAYNRSMLINAYQLCLNSSHFMVRKRAVHLGAPVQSTHVVSLTNFTNPVSLLYSSPNDPYCIYVNSSLESLTKRTKRAIDERRLIEHDVVTCSFDILNQIIKSEIEGALKIAELLYWAHHRYSENSFSDALILSWTACEKLISHLWDKFVRSKKGIVDGIERMNKERVRKLEGRDFTASIVTEILELSEVISPQLFRGLDNTRKKRNDWLHSLADIKNRDAIKALRTATDLFGVATGVSIRPSLHRIAPGTGGVPLHMYTFSNES